MIKVNYLDQVIKQFFPQEKIISGNSVWALWSRIGWRVVWNYRLNIYYLLGGRHKIIETQNFYFLDTRPFYGIRGIQTLVKIYPIGLLIIFLIVLYGNISFSVQDLSISGISLTIANSILLTTLFGFSFLYLSLYYIGYFISVFPKTKFIYSGQKLVDLTGSTLDLIKLPLFTYILPKNRLQQLLRDVYVAIINLVIAIFGKTIFSYLLINPEGGNFIMINEELKTFISKMRVAGKTDLEITAELITAGWSEADITLALNPQPVLTIDDQSPARLDLQEEKSRTKSHRSIWMWSTLIMVAFLVGGYLTLRILPNLLVKSLKKQGQTSVTYPTPAAIATSPIMFPKNIIQFTIPSSWYTKEEKSGQNSYQMKFVYKTDPEKSEDYPEYAMQATVTYPAGQSAEINNLNGMVTSVRSLLTKTADGEKVKAADSTSDFSQNLQTVTNVTNLPGKTDILADKDLTVAGLPGHSFEYTNEINKIINKKDKDASGKFVESSVSVHRVEHVRDLIVFDRQNNLIVIEFKATDSSWPQRASDFNQIASSLVVLYK